MKKEKIDKINKMCEYYDFKFIKGIRKGTILIFECKNKHLIHTSLQSLERMKYKCNECRTNEMLKIVKDIAKEKGGECLSDNYKNCNTKMDFICKNNHYFETCYDAISMGKWCKWCANNQQKNIKDCYIIAKEKMNGKCLSTKYKNAHTKMLWECENGHIYESTYNNISNGYKCMECYGNKKKTIKDCMNLAKEKINGICLSIEYKNAHTKMHWKCDKGHILIYSYNELQQSYMCTECNGNKTENYCRTLFEKITLLKFKKIRPKWLLNIDNNRLEYDGYCETVKIAFEYNGIQHYQYNDYFHKTYDVYERTILNDYMKYKISIIKNIKLIVIPYYITKPNLKKYIYDELLAIDKNIVKITYDEMLNLN